MREMGTLNQAELQNLRHLIGAQQTSYEKLTNYADNSVDPQIKQILNNYKKNKIIISFIHH